MMIMTLKPFRLAMGQMLVEGGRREANLKRAEDMIEEAARRGCGILILPECLDLGWTHPSARELADEIPGSTSDRLSRACRQNDIMAVAGLTERDGERIYNAAILIDGNGEIILKYRKINILEIARGLYSVGNILSVVETDLGNIGINICADNFESSLAIGHVLSRMGAHFIFSPSAWAVVADHDDKKNPYGEEWVKSYTKLSRLYDIAIVGVSSVGWITAGPWKGRKMIGCSLAVGPEGKILARGPYGVNAETLICITLKARERTIEGVEYSEYLKMRGYEGP
ncbi:TPA: carbon-nitrogen hydrolase family protein [Candidatus Bathyarchaeota archaeon]|nr:carbon-nitrogen hydrolase family protein [Candidatus Bathyarchaeota archaeon]